MCMSQRVLLNKTCFPMKLKMGYKKRDAAKAHPFAASLSTVSLRPVSYPYRSMILPSSSPPLLLVYSSSFRSNIFAPIPFPSSITARYPNAFGV